MESLSGASHVLAHAFCTVQCILCYLNPYPDLLPIRPTFLSEVYRHNKVREKTEPFSRRASFSCSSGEVYPHLPQHPTPGGQGPHPRPEVGTRAIVSCNQHESQSYTADGGEPAPGWFLGPRMCEVNRSCAFRQPACMEAFQRDSLSSCVKERTSRCPAPRHLFWTVNGVDIHRKQS